MHREQHEKGNKSLPLITKTMNGSDWSAAVIDSYS